MGMWHISVVGSGIHHNGVEADADQIFKRLVDELKAAGAMIENATFTHGGRNTADTVQPLKEATVT